MPSDREPFDLDERTLRIGRQLFAEVRQERSREKASLWRGLAKPDAERMQAPDLDLD